MKADDPIHSIQVIDSHTAGEPTRVVIAGGPDLGTGTLKERLQRFREGFDHYRTALINEPRGFDVIVGALLCEPDDEQTTAAVIFFNNVGYLGMCGHGMIGVVETLRSLGRLDSDRCTVQTPVGIVHAKVDTDGTVLVENVESYRTASDVKLDIDGIGSVIGDVAWGGNWFFLVREPEPEITLARKKELIAGCHRIREEVRAAGYPQVDHVELFCDPESDDADSRNFVLCPGGQFDRSPCGTGTSAKLACLAADRKLLPETPWLQEGVLGTSFVAHYRWSDASKRRIIPTIGGRAFITAETTFRIDPQDPFAWGITM